MGCSGCKSKKVRPVVKGSKTRNNIRRKTYTAEDTPNKLDAFHLGSLQDFINFRLLCKEHGITDEQVQEYVDSRLDARMNEEVEIVKNQEIDNFVIDMNKIPACPKCGNSVAFERVNTMPCNRVGGKYRFLMQCIDWKNCGWEYYSREDNIVDFVRRNRRILKSQLVTHLTPLEQYHEKYRDTKEKQDGLL